MCDLPEIGDIFMFLAAVADAAGERSGIEPPPFPAMQNEVAPATVRGVGFAPGRTPGETLLVIRFLGFDLGFHIPREALAQFARDGARIAATLSADMSRQN
jgi:hypothetical protein